MRRDVYKPCQNHCKGTINVHILSTLIFIMLLNLKKENQLTVNTNYCQQRTKNKQLIRNQFQMFRKHTKSECRFLLDNSIMSP